MNPPPAVPPEVSLREVRTSDLPILFEHQLDPEGARMAAFPSRQRDAFMAHWTKIMASPTGTTRAILSGGSVAGHIGAWTDGPDRLVGYWIGREFWSHGGAGAISPLRYDPPAHRSGRETQRRIDPRSSESGFHPGRRGRLRSA